MLQKKSVLARLLANENISVRQGNFPTASFDVVNRVLNLPNWKDMSNDLYDMLVGHEVSHALNTPSDPEVLNIPNVPFSFVNIVEDIRIEKLIMRKYPGLVGNFTRGYDELMEMDIFGTKDQDLNEMPFMDRLNIKSKGRAAVEVEFSDEETPYFEKAMAVETFEDVREVVLELAEWLRSKNEIDENDIAVISGDAKIFIDAKSFAFLDGTQLDFVKEGLNEGFEFKNPNVKNECGCGESFHV